MMALAGSPLARHVVELGELMEQCLDIDVQLGAGRGAGLRKVCADPRDIARTWCWSDRLSGYLISRNSFAELFEAKPVCPLHYHKQIGRGGKFDG